MTRRIFMTEFANLANHEYTDPMDLAKTIYKTLTIADAAMYLQVRYWVDSSATLLATAN